MECLAFQPFIPKGTCGKDFSKLEEAIRYSESHRILQKGFFCSFIRGSAVSGYDGGIVKAHSRSDVDVSTVSEGLHRRTVVYHGVLPGRNGDLVMPVEVNNLDIGKVKCELEGLGERGFSSMADFVADCLGVQNKPAFETWRQVALLSFMRLGFGGYGDTSMVTPSGAMKAINQARLIVNPIRWWSVEYAFKASATAQQNVFRYYTDVEQMLAANFRRAGRLGDEDMYEVPAGLALKPNYVYVMLKYFYEKGLGRFLSSGVAWENFLKVRNKGMMLAVGLVEGKTNIDRIFQQESLPVLHA